MLKCEMLKCHSETEVLQTRCVISFPTFCCIPITPRLAAFILILSVSRENKQHQQ